MSLFSLFCCCFKSTRRSLPDQPNETSPLIPPSDDVLPTARHIIIDQQRMKERLGVIVRAKEGKMVNVNAPLPFNLSNTTNKRPRLSRLRTRSPHPSLDTEHQSVVSSASASASALHELDEDVHRPTLNVRIVRGGSALARGRPVLRDVVVPEPETTGEGEGATTESGLTPAEEPGLEAAAAFPTIAVADAVTAPAATVATEGARPSRMSGTIFKIQNVGSLSRSWGD